MHEIPAEGLALRAGAALAGPWSPWQPQPTLAALAPSEGHLDNPSDGGSAVQSN